MNAASSFSNEPLNVEGLPRLSAEGFVPLHPNYLRVALIGRAVTAVVFVVIAVAVMVFADLDRWIPLTGLGVLLVLLALSAVLQVIEVRHLAYQVREHDITYRSGVISRTETTQPFVRVQNAEVERGPIQQRFGLATVRISAAGMGSGLAISGLGEDDAERIKELVLSRAGDLVNKS